MWWSMKNWKTRWKKSGCIISGERMKRVRQLNGLKTVVDALVKEAEEMKAE